MDDYLLWTGTPHGDDPDVLAPVRDDRGPEPVADGPYDEEPGFVFRPGRYFDEQGVLPQGLCLHEVDSVLGPVRLALVLVEFELHGRDPSLFHAQNYTVSIPAARLSSGNQGKQE